MAQLGVVIGWILTIFLGVLGGIILWLILIGKIDLAGLISEPNGEASLSRFQFLVFTFVVALSLFYLIVAGEPPPKYPIIPGQILALLGISGGSYVVSKGIQSSRDIGMTQAIQGTGDGTVPPPTTTTTTTTTTPATPPTPPTTPTTTTMTTPTEGV
jgi:uncharacterized BrkB/YihY/UPF0761 family membrane protein